MDFKKWNAIVSIVEHDLTGNLRLLLAFPGFPGLREIFDKF